MQITRRCPFTGAINTLEINVLQEEIDDWSSGTVAQRAMPSLTPDEREFIMTGIMPDVWEDTFNDDLRDEEF
jgi:hypothetical protein